MGAINVLLVEPYGHLGGHYSMYTKLLGDALAEAGVNVTIVTFDGLLGQVENVDKIKYVSFLSRGGVFPYLFRFLQNRGRSSLLLRFMVITIQNFLTIHLALQLAKNRPSTVIHILDSEPFFLPTLAPFVLNQSLVFTLPYPLPSKDFKSRLRTLLVKYSIKCGFGRGVKRNRIFFVCHTPEVGEFYVKSMPRMFRGRSSYIPWGVKEPKTLTKSESQRYLNLTDAGTVFLTFGVTHGGKNFKTIFQAIQSLPKDFIILHAGTITDKTNDPRLLAKSYGWSSNTIVVNQYIAEEKMMYYFSAADAIILSYKKVFLNASGVLSHACQFLLPVIASDVGQLGDFVKTYKLGLTFTPEDPSSLREAIISFLNLPEDEKLKIRDNLRRFTFAHSWKEIAKKHIDVYKNAIQALGEC